MIAHAVYSYLTADAGVSALIGTRVYRTILPQGATLPAAVRVKLPTTKIHTHGGPSNLMGCRIQLTAHADSQEAADSLAVAISTALDASTFVGTWASVVIRSSLVQNEVDLGFVEATETYQVAVDAIIQYLR